MHTLTSPSWRTSFGGRFIRNVFPLGKSGWQSTPDSRNEGKRKPKKNTPIWQPHSIPSPGFSAWTFPTPSRSTTWHGWTGLAGLIIPAHRYSSRTPTIGAHSSELDQKPGSEKWQKAYPSPPRSRALGTGGRAGPQTPMRLVHGSPFFSPLRTWRRNGGPPEITLCSLSPHLRCSSLKMPLSEVWR